MTVEVKSRNFVFDIVVTHFEATYVNLPDPKQLEIEVTFNKISIQIPPNRINVNDFDPKYGLEFNMLPRTLRNRIESSGLPVNVKYNKRSVGTGLIVLPHSVTDRIGEDMSDLIYSDSCNFEKNGQVLGTVEILFRLIIKCEDIPNTGDAKCRDIDKSISPQDILFVMGESQQNPNLCDICLDVVDEDDGRLELDLQRYRSINANFEPKPTFMHNPIDNFATSQLKSMIKDCEDIVDSITKRTGLPKPFIASSHIAEEGQNNSNENNINAPSFSYLSARQGDSTDFCDRSLIPMPISDFNQFQTKPNRYCPVCLTNMSWMPKFAACPKCGIKPMPVIEERHKTKKLTAESVLLEYLGKSNTNADSNCIDVCNKEEHGEEKPCRCTCKGGKVCAHCRIRKLCADIFKTEEKAIERPKVEAKSSDDYHIDDDESMEYRPYLARVFSELRDLYITKDTARELVMPSKVNKKSTQKTIGTAEKNDRPYQNSTKEFKREPKKKFAVQKESRKPHLPVVKKQPIGRVGHKNCIEQKGFVSRRHGWDWSSTPEAVKHGWRPGSILKPIKRLMKFFLQYLPEDKALNSDKIINELETETYKKNELSTLNICKKNGDIFITYRGLYDPNFENRHLEYKIVKSDLAVALSEIKQALKRRGFRKCTCHRSIMLCVCRSVCEKQQLQHFIAEECHRRKMQSCIDQLVLTDTSDSEMEFDFDISPPASLAKAAEQPTVSATTQTSNSNHKLPPDYPKITSPYWRAYDCATGDRYTGTAFGRPGEVVFEDGVFGLRGGGPHGASATPGGKPKTESIWGARTGALMHHSGGIGAGNKFGGIPFPGAKTESILGARTGALMRHSGGIGAGNKFGGTSFPGAKNKSEAGKQNKNIPVRMPQRYYKAVKAAEQAKEAAKERDKKKKGINMMNYIEKKNLSKIQKKREREKKTGQDGLTTAQRRRKNLLSSCPPPLETIPRRGTYHQANCYCYDPCVNNSNNNWYYNNHFYSSPWYC